jgi:hypothetical protein
LTRAPGETFWAHYDHFRQKIVEKLQYFWITICQN